MHSCSPFGLIVSQLLPGVDVNLRTYKVPFLNVFEAQMGTASWALALSKLPVQDVFQDVTMFHSMSVAYPMQSVLSQERVHARETSTR